MSKLTKEERAEVETIMENWLEWSNINRDGTITELLQIDKNKLIEWVEQKKKQWQEEAVAEYKLKNEMETKFFQDSISMSEAKVITEEDFARWERLSKNETKELLSLRKEVGKCLQTCREQNGLPYCKNCGLGADKRF